MNRKVDYSLICTGPAMMVGADLRFLFSITVLQAINYWVMHSAFEFKVMEFRFIDGGYFCGYRGDLKLTKGRGTFTLE